MSDLVFTPEELELIYWAVREERKKYERDAFTCRERIDTPEKIAELPPGVEGELEYSADLYEEDARNLKAIEAKLKEAGVDGWGC